MKTITVKGVGSAASKPDLVLLSIALRSINMDYERSMKEAADKVSELNESLIPLGFEKEAIKTTDFHVDTEYESKKDRYGNYYREFQGYAVTHDMKLSYDFDTKLLSRVLTAIALCASQPEISVRFTIKDPSAVRKLMLENAAKNAREKAEILCKASGVELGEIVTIDYNWGEVNVFSSTRYSALEECALGCSDGINMDIEPDEINASDTVTFVWQIK